MVFASSLALCAGGCGGALDSPDGGGSPDAAGPPAVDAAVDATMYPAPHPPPPQVTSPGGAVLAAPRIVPVFFSNDDAAFKAQIKDFLSKVGATNYWKAATAEYDNIGPATATAPVELTETAPAMLMDSDIQAWLAGKLNANDPTFPTPDANTVYALHYPAGVTISNQGFRGTTEQSCQAFGGYHADLQLDANHAYAGVAYAVIPRCSQFNGASGIDAVTVAESHELIEAATNPHPMLDPAYGQLDSDHFYWSSALGGAEVGDMCAQDPQAYTRFAELPYMVQRTWSNKSAMAGHDPCVPELSGQVYFNTAPVLSEMITLMTRAGAVTLPGVQIPVGQTKTIDVDLFSDADPGSIWTVTASDAALLTGGQATLSLMLDKHTGHNGDKIHLTIKTVTTARRHTFMLVSHLGSQEFYWFGIVGE
jgi:hypothetical protein